MWNLYVHRHLEYSVDLTCQTTEKYENQQYYKRDLFSFTSRLFFYYIKWKFNKYVI